MWECPFMWQSMKLYQEKVQVIIFCELLAKKIIFNSPNFLKTNPIVLHQEHYKSKCWQNTKLGEQWLFSARLNKRNRTYNKCTVKMQ